MNFNEFPSYSAAVQEFNWSAPSLSQDENTASLQNNLLDDIINHIAEKALGVCQFSHYYPEYSNIENLTYFLSSQISKGENIPDSIQKASPQVQALLKAAVQGEKLFDKIKQVKEKADFEKDITEGNVKCFALVFGIGRANELIEQKDTPIKPLTLTENVTLSEEEIQALEEGKAEIEKMNQEVNDIIAQAAANCNQKNTQDGSSH